MAMLFSSQPKQFRSENIACCRKRKIISPDDQQIVDVKEFEKDNKILRTAMLKKRYASVILKSQKDLCKAFGEKDMKNKTKLWEKQFLEEKAKSQLQRDREMARMAIASIKRTVDFDDALQAEQELLAMIGKKQLVEGKAKFQRQRDREAARMAIASIKRTVDFDDSLQAEIDLLAIMDAPSCW